MNRSRCRLAFWGYELIGLSWSQGIMFQLEAKVLPGKATVYGGALKSIVKHCVSDCYTVIRAKKA